MDDRIVGRIFNIQRFSLHDGPGIRTLVFMKGCPLRCRWCSNPEGFSKEIEISCDSRKCIGCGACAAKCPKQAVKLEAAVKYNIDRSICDRCGLCVKLCPTGAKVFCGEDITADEIIEKVKRDMPFYKGGEGGVTLGGGEILLQPAFVYEVLKRCKSEGINTAVETSGFGEWEWLSRIAGVSDTVFFDIKAIKGRLHESITGVDNKLILENLKALDRKLSSMNPKPTLILRIPLVSGFNATELNAHQTANFIMNELSAYDLVELLLFHNMGEQKYSRMDLHYELEGRPNAKAEDYAGLADVMKSHGLSVRISKW